MAYAKRFVPHSINIHTAAGVSTFLDAIKSYAPDMGVELIEESGGSETDREFVSIRAVSPKMAISSTDLSFLATCGFLGIPIAPAVGAPGVVAWGREQLSGALPTAIGTTNHLQMTVSDGLLVPMSIRASHNQVAEFTMMLYAILGVTPTYSKSVPMLFETGKAITTGAGQVANIYTAGPIKYDSRLVLGILDLSVDFGISVQQEGDTGDVYPSQVPIISRNPKINFTTKDAELIATIGDGFAITTFAAYFTKCTANGQRVAAATATHIKVNATAGVITPAALTFAHRVAGVTPYTFTPAKNTNVIAISTTSAIPTT